jgi:hypothetical protein
MRDATICMSYADRVDDAELAQWLRLMAGEYLMQAVRHYQARTQNRQQNDAAAVGIPPILKRNDFDLSGLSKHTAPKIPTPQPSPHQRGGK